MTTISPHAEALEDPFARQRELLDDWVDVGTRIGALEAERVELLARRLDLLAQERLSGDEMAFRSMCAEYAAAGHVSPSTFAEHICAAWILARTLPATLDALASGTISKRHADVIVAAAPSVSGHADAERIRAEYEEQVVPLAQSETAARTRAQARSIAAAVFPEGMDAQHKRARSERAVKVKSDGDGMAVLTAILPEILAYAIHDRLTQMGNEAIKSRPEGQRRPRRSKLEAIRAEREAALAQQAPSEPEQPAAIDEELVRDIEEIFDEAPPWENGDTSADGDAFPTGTTWTDHGGEDEYTDREYGDDLCIDEGDMLDADLSSEAVSHESTPMHDGYGVIEDDTRSLDQLRADIFADMLLTAAPTSITDTALGSVKATVQVTISASSLNAAGDADDSMAELDGHGPMTSDAARILAGRATSWDRVFLDPGGMVIKTDNYVPTAGMKRFLHARDQHCRFPGCRAPAHRCQIDHNHDHAKGGPTALSNLSLFCTSHHPLKHPDLDERDQWTARQLDGGVILWTSPLGRTYTDEPPLRVMFR